MWALFILLLAATGAAVADSEHAGSHLQLQTPLAKRHVRREIRRHPAKEIQPPSGAWNIVQSTGDVSLVSRSSFLQEAAGGASSFLETAQPPESGVDDDEKPGAEKKSLQRVESGDVPFVELFPAPFGSCKDKVGESSVVVSGFNCRKLGGMARNESLADEDIGACLLDFCSDGMYAMFPPGKCDDSLAETTVTMGKGDCKELGGLIPKNHMGTDAEMIQCTFAICYDTGGYALRPAGTCNQPVLAAETQAQECRNLFGNVDPQFPGDRWSNECQLDLCKSYVRARLEVDTRGVPDAATMQGALVQFQVLGNWEKSQMLCLSTAENETVSKEFDFAAWPEKVKIIPSGPDMWGIREIRMIYRGSTVRILGDIPVMGMSNDEAHPASQYWVGLAGEKKADMPGSGPSPTFLEYDVPHLTRQWRAFGSDLGCHTRDLLGGMDGKEATETSVSSLAECKLLCEVRSDCFGLEVEMKNWRCILFHQPIRRQYEAPGHECYTVWNDPKLVSPEVPKEDAYYRMFQSMAARCLDYDPEADEDSGSAAFVHDCSLATTQQWHFEDGIFFSKGLPPKCLTVGSSNESGVGQNIVVVDCGHSSNATASNETNQAAQTLALTKVKASELNWRTFVEPGPNVTRWTWNGRRLKSGNLCVDTNITSWGVTLQECNHQLVNQDFAFVEDPEWKSTLFGGEPELSENA